MRWFHPRSQSNARDSMFEGNAATVIGKRVGNYIVERALAQGNMGSVFVARHPALGRQVAVKFLGRDLESTPDLTKRFLDEARITANLRHPNVVDIFDFGELDGRLYYVMELLDGQDLSELIASKRRFACGEVVEFLEQICSGLAAAHAMGVVHRDLKPGNIFVLRGEPPRIKLMDFGVAKILSTTGEQTHYGQIIGTPRYMCPEQALGQIDLISPKSDLYSLGVIAYEMLAGVSPFNHDSPVMLLVMHVRDVVRPIEEIVPGLPQSLCELIASCLAKDPKDRPVSAQDVLDRIGALRQESGIRRAEAQPLHSPQRRAIDPMAADAKTVVPSTNLEQTAASLHVEPVAPAQEPTAEQPRAEPAEPLKNGGSPGDENPTILVAVDSPAVLVQAPSNDTATLASLDAPKLQSIQRATVNLSETDRTTLNRLLSRMQRRGDFPAFVQNVGEVSKRADFEGSFSAEQLGTSILKDYGLTAKLLRIVNSTYANRFGGRIYSIRHAIVILGFDRVRSLALSTSLFKNQGNKEHADRISESAINSLVSGEIARQLHAEAELEDPEQATVCAMFRNLGRHLVLVYLPEMYDQIVALMQQDGLTLNQASERVLGLSMHKLGVGIAERWRLPTKVIAAMSVIPQRTGKLKRDEEKLAALAEFSNHLCEIVADETTGEQRSMALKTLVNRHKNFLQLEPDYLDTLLQTTQRAVERRYASLLGNATHTSRFARTVATLAGQNTPDIASPPVEPTAALANATVTSNLDIVVARSLAECERSGCSDQLLSALLRAVAKHLEVPRILALRAAVSRRELAPVGGVGDDIDGLTKELRLPLSPARAAIDPFSSSYHSQRDIFFEDVFAPKVISSLPQRYFEVVGSTCLAILACADKGAQPLILLIDLDPPLKLPALERVAQLTQARRAIAMTAPLVTS
jgi:serine/threonine protein kinase